VIARDVFGRDSLEVSDTTVFASALENLFLPPFTAVLEEYGPPASTSLKLAPLLGLARGSRPRRCPGPAARGMGFYLIVFQGGNAVGSAVMDLTAERAGLSLTLSIAAAGLALGPLAGLVWRFTSIPAEDLQPAGEWPAPQLALDQAPGGPILVSVEYWARPGADSDLLTALHLVGFSRRRTGATAWRAWRDSSNASRILEQFVVASWDEHLRQHEHVTRRDQDRLDRVRDLTDPARPVTVTHWLTLAP
jgi:Transmembrane secretion effector